jgi:hypothetical protein
MEILSLIIGGFIAIAGGWASQAFQLRYVVKLKMGEAMAERKVRANGEAYAHIKRIEGSFVQNSIRETAKMTLDLEQWFFDNRFFLPGEFPDHWLTVRTNLHLLAMEPSNRPIDHTEALQKKVGAAISGAIGAIYKDSGIPRPTWDKVVG